MKSHYFHLLRILWIVFALLGTYSIPSSSSSRPHSKILEQLNSLDQHVQSSRAYRGDSWKNIHTKKIRSSSSLWNLPKPSEVSFSVHDEEGLLMKYLIFRFFWLSELSVKTISSTIRILGDTFAGVFSGIMKGVGSSLNLLASGISHLSLHISPPDTTPLVDKEATEDRSSSNQIELNMQTTKWYHFASLRRDISKGCLQLGKIMYGTGQLLIWIGEVTEDTILGLGEALQDSFRSVEIVIHSTHKLAAYMLIVLSKSKRENTLIKQPQNIIDVYARSQDLVPVIVEKEELQTKRPLQIKSPLRTAYKHMTEILTNNKNKTISLANFASITFTNTKNRTSLEKYLNNTLKRLWKHLLAPSTAVNVDVSVVNTTALNEPQINITAALPIDDITLNTEYMEANKIDHEANLFGKNFSWLNYNNTTRKHQQLSLDTIVHCIRMTERYTTFLYDVIHDTLKYDANVNSKKPILHRTLPNFDENIYEIPSIGWSLGIMFFLLWCIFMLLSENENHQIPRERNWRWLSVPRHRSYSRCVWIGVLLLISWCVLIKIEYIQRYRLLTRYRLNQFNQDINTQISTHHVIHHSNDLRSARNVKHRSDNLLTNNINKLQSEQDLRFIPMQLPTIPSSTYTKCSSDKNVMQEIEERSVVETIGNSTYYHFEPPTKVTIDDLKQDESRANNSFDTGMNGDKMMWLNVIFQSLWTMLDVQVLETTTILYPFKPSSVPTSTANVPKEEFSSFDNKRPQEATEKFMDEQSSNTPHDSNHLTHAHETAPELHLGSSSGIGLGNYMNEMYAEMLQSQLADDSSPGITQVRLRTFDLGSSPPYFLDITSHILRNDTCVAQLLEHVNSKYHSYHDIPSSHSDSNQPDLRKLKMHEIYSLIKRFWKDHYVYLHPHSHQDASASQSHHRQDQFESLFGSQRKYEGKTGRAGHGTKTHRFAANHVVDADESWLRDMIEEMFYGFFHPPGGSADLGGIHASPPPPFSPPTTAASHHDSTTSSSSEQQDPNMQKAKINDSWETFKQFAQSLFQTKNTKDSSGANNSTTVPSNITDMGTELPTNTQPDHHEKLQNTTSSATYPLSSYPIYHTNQFILPCDVLYIEMPFIFTSKDMKIIFSLRNEDMRYSMVPELSVTLGGLHIQGRLLLTIQLTPDYPFFGNATMRLSELPELDFQISSFKGGLDLTSIPMLYRFVNTTFYSLLTQYTDPMYTTVDMRHNLCPHCDEPPPPSFQVTLLSTTAAMGQALRGNIMKWFRRAQRMTVMTNPAKIWQTWQEKLSKKLNEWTLFGREKLQHFFHWQKKNSTIDISSNHSTPNNNYNNKDSAIQPEGGTEEDENSQHSDSSSSSEQVLASEHISLPWWKKAWQILQFRGKRNE